MSRASTGPARGRVLSALRLRSTADLQVGTDRHALAEQLISRVDRFASTVRCLVRTARLPSQRHTPQTSQRTTFHYNHTTNARQLLTPTPPARALQGLRYAAGSGRYWGIGPAGAGDAESRRGFELALQDLSKVRRLSTAQSLYQWRSRRSRL